MDNVSDLWDGHNDDKFPLPSSEKKVFKCGISAIAAQ